jgi:hypothetical protein
MTRSTLTAVPGTPTLTGGGAARLRQRSGIQESTAPPGVFDIMVGSASDIGSRDRLQVKK